MWYSKIPICCVYYQQVRSIVFEKGEGAWTDDPEIKKNNNHTLQINRKEKHFMAGCYALLIFHIIGLGKNNEL